MKQCILLLTLLFCLSLKAQGELLDVSATVNISSAHIQVEQHLKFNLPDTVKQIEIKALQLEGTELLFNNAISDNELLTGMPIATKGLTHLKLTSANPLKEVIIRYTLKVDKEIFYIPLFFTNLTAAGSENNFFKLRVAAPEIQKYNLLFPDVITTKKVVNHVSITNLELPALPSLLRLEKLSNKSKGVRFLNFVDGFVALIFLIIGGLVWKNRKRLIYG